MTTEDAISQAKSQAESPEVSSAVVRRRAWRNVIAIAATGLLLMFAQISNPTKGDHLQKVCDHDNIKGLFEVERILNGRAPKILKPESEWERFDYRNFRVFSIMHGPSPSDKVFNKVRSFGLFGRIWVFE